ncbi:MAG: DUF2019 domain-containing protein, partial [Beijerinckiaceae bacterium]|nr:DUF2019 domain-containing protein [Beijerinckiaceae bacterium]
LRSQPKPNRQSPMTTPQLHHAMGHDQLQSRAGDRRILLRQFYNHRNSQVALTAARATLAIDYVDARRVIEEIAESDDFPQAGDAGMALWAMEEGIYKPV